MDVGRWTLDVTGGFSIEGAAAWAAFRAWRAARAD